MLTDIFVDRYDGRLLWDEFGRKQQKLLLQSFRLLKEQIAPFYDSDGNISKYGKDFWTDLHNRISTELGVKSLSPLAFPYATKFQGTETSHTVLKPIITVCEEWMLQVPGQRQDIDEFMKERLSLVEVAFRKKEEEIKQENDTLSDRIAAARMRPQRVGSIRLPGDIGEGMKAQNRRINARFHSAATEFNTRLQQSGSKLHYHNGFVQLSSDELVQKTVEGPFWQLVADPVWKNVDLDMKEAFDRRDNEGRDPAFYAARALESTLKIISEKKGGPTAEKKVLQTLLTTFQKKTRALLSLGKRMR